MSKKTIKNHVEEKKGYNLWQLLLALVLGVVVTAGVIYVPSFGGQGFIGQRNIEVQNNDLEIDDVFSISKALKSNIDETYGILGDIENEIRGIGSEDLNELVIDLNDELARVEIELNATLKLLNDNSIEYSNLEVAKAIGEVNGLVNLAKARSLSMLNGVKENDLTRTNSIVRWDLNLDGQDELIVDLRESIPNFFDESLKFLDSAGQKMENLRFGIYPNPTTEN